MTKMMQQDYVQPTAMEVGQADLQLTRLQKVIEYDTKEFTIELLVQKFAKPDDGEQPELYVPPYQRQFNWDARRQSRFIESVLMGLPIPFLFFADLPDGRLEIVDGLQRLSTCELFLDNGLVLVGLERLDEVDGFKYSDLPRSQQRRLKNRTIRCIVLSQNATEQDRRDLFDRINTSSLIAEPAEIRRGSIPGPLTDLIDQLAKNIVFIKLCPTTEQASREREREELVLRFFVLHDGMTEPKILEEYNDRMRQYMDAWLRRNNDAAVANPAITNSYKMLFEEMLRFVAAYFPYGFAKNPQAKTTPRVRFDAIAIGASLAMRQKPGLRPSDVNTWLNSDDFTMFTTSSAANVRSRIVGRIQYVREQLLK